MGHLTKIANNIVDQWEKTALGDFISANVSEETITKWNEFVAGPLSEINQKHQIVLGGVHPSHSLSSDNQDEFSAIDFPTGGIQNVTIFYNISIHVNFYHWNRSKLGL